MIAAAAPRDHLSGHIRLTCTNGLTSRTNAAVTETLGKSVVGSNKTDE
jgi:hypothetical protein